MDALVALRAEMFRAMGTADVAGERQDAARAWFTARLDDPDVFLAVVDAAGVVVASGLGEVRRGCPAPANPVGGDVLISSVCTRPEHRGHGCGAAVFDAVLAWARTTGVGRVELHASAEGLPMYERRGFEPISAATMRLRLG